MKKKGRKEELKEGVKENQPARSAGWGGNNKHKSISG